MARLVLVAPGRGSYNRTELGYLTRYADHPRADLAEAADEIRARLGRPTITALDTAASYSPRVHLPGENASSLIFTCAAADMALVNPSHEIVGVCGNSMGWYIALYVGAALDFTHAFTLIETMGHFQKDQIIGGQIIYPLVDDDWRIEADREAEVEGVLAEIRSRGADHWVGPSIRLGGFLVLAGTDAGIKALLSSLPKVKLGAHDYPFQLARHSAFHTYLMKETSRRALYQLHNLVWTNPTVPMIDGRGHTWRPHRTVSGALRDYTLIDQVTEPYDFTTSLRVAIREHNPDHLVLLGPGETLGGAIAHVIIAEGWRGICDKDAFIRAQKSDHPPLIAMNRPDQAAHVI